MSTDSTTGKLRTTNDEKSQLNTCILQQAFWLVFVYPQLEYIQFQSSWELIH